MAAFVAFSSSYPGFSKCIELSLEPPALPRDGWQLAPLSPT
jgi:hypothetical protein